MRVGTWRRPLAAALLVASVGSRPTEAWAQTDNPQPPAAPEAWEKIPCATTPDEPPAALRERYTRVLRGHLALAALRFPKGVAGPHLDTIARVPLWEAGLDYDHGTGHGVGSFLSVHEGPASFSRAAKTVPLEPGMILSDEPGFYLPGQYGIRIENLVLTISDESNAFGDFYTFEHLTVALIDTTPVRKELLDERQVKWLNDYNQEVVDKLGPHLKEDELVWLKEKAKAI